MISLLASTFRCGSGSGSVTSRLSPLVRQHSSKTVQISVNRDSVSMGDDTSGHHSSLVIHVPSTPLQLVQRIVQGYPLAAISGGNATWVLQINRRDTAVVAQQWHEPRMLLAVSESDLTDEAINEAMTAHFRYLGQACPDKVYEENRVR